jgi:adenylate cyclase
VRHFQKALEKDPEYALAWAGLADTYSLMGEYTNISRRELYPKQMEAIDKALKIDSRLSEAHISLAISLMLNEWDWKKSEQEFRLGIELNPNYATGHHWYAEWLLFRGRTEEAFNEINLAVGLDPVSQGIMKDKGILYYYNREFDKAIEVAKTTLELDQHFVPAHRLLSLAYQAIGNYEEAIRENQLWGEGTGSELKTKVALAQIFATAGRESEARNIIAELGSEAALGGNDYRAVALIYVALGEKDLAFEWLEKSFQRHEESLCSLNVDPKLDSIRDDPRFKKLVSKIGLLN